MYIKFVLANSVTLVVYNHKITTVLLETGQVFFLGHSMVVFMYIALVDLSMFLAYQI